MFGMPRKMVWIERILSFWESRVFPSRKFKAILHMGALGEVELAFILARISFSIVIWLTGLLVYAFDGLLFLYLSDLQTYGMLLGMAPLVFWGAGALYYWLRWFFSFVRPILALSEMEFENFRDRIERFANSFLPCLLLALVFFFFLTDVFDEFQLMCVSGLKLHALWHFGYSFFSWLLIATGVWTVISIWLPIFSLSRQPLNLELSPKAFKVFRALGLASLGYSLFYFLGVSIAVFFPPPGTRPAVAPLKITVAIYCLFALIGVIGAVLPFYNFHKVMVGLKKQELQKIEEAEKVLLQELDDVLTKPKTRIRRDDIGLITARLTGLQIRERRVREAEDWPVDISFFSTLAAIVLVPLIIELVTRIFLL